MSDHRLPAAGDANQHREPAVVSIIITNYNYGRFLGAAIDSALHQRYDHTEVIVVDDGSTDDSPQVLESFGTAITPVYQPNGGQAAAMNSGFRRATGDLILFLDADDTLLPDAAGEVARHFTDGGISKLHWPLIKIDDRGRPSGIVFPPASRLVAGHLLPELIERGPNHLASLPQSPPNSGNAWNRAFLEQVFPLSEPEYRQGGNDYHLSALAPLFGEVKAIREPLGHYRIHGHNDTLKPMEDYIDTFYRWHDHTEKKAEEWIERLGYPLKSGRWQRDGWYSRLRLALRDLDDLVPPGEGLVLIDEGSISNSRVLSRRQRIPYRKDRGLPADDEEAIAEAEALARAGVSWLCYLWPAFWQLEHYHHLHHYLNSRHTPVLKNEQLIIYHLRQEAPEPPVTETSAADQNF